MSDAGDGRLPLSALLSQVLVAFIIECDNEYERQIPHRTLFAGLELPPGGWRAAVRARDTLPQYPMVLHRGGYPHSS
jgi:hypothetical protein